MRAVHEYGLDPIERDRLSIWDGLVSAAASIAECGIRHAEDGQAGPAVDGRLRRESSFAQTPR